MDKVIRLECLKCLKTFPNCPKGIGQRLVGCEDCDQHYNCVQIIECKACKKHFKEVI